MSSWLGVKCSCHACWLVICVAFGVGVHVRDYCLMLLCGLWWCSVVLSGVRVRGLCLF